MDIFLSTEMRLLEVLYSSLAEFVVWSEFYDRLAINMPFSSPRVVVFWMYNFIQILEMDLITSLGEYDVSNYLCLCLELFFDRYNTMNLIVSTIFHDL